MNKEDQAKLYEQAMGKEALERQQRLAKEQCGECGYKHNQHHPACARGRRAANQKKHHKP